MEKLDNVNIIVNGATKFYNSIQKEKNGRYKSWEYCYKIFHDARKNKKECDIDKLSLNLAFYLASWGMYRGSSFLLQKDYTIHKEAIKIILKEKYDVLFGIKCEALRKNENIKVLFELKDEIDKYYDTIRKEVAKNMGKETSKANLSETLSSKILMGTLGCVPAYDRYFISGAKSTGITTGIFNKNSILRICDFYISNLDKLEKVRKKLKIENIEYPQMKLIDMGLWNKGFENEE